MNCLSPVRVFSLCLPFFASANANTLIRDEVIVYEGKTMKVIVPDHPLALGSLKITTNSNSVKFSEWKAVNEQESYEFLQKVVRIWEKKGVPDYLIFGKESNNDKDIFGWEIVPFSKKECGFSRQFKVLWNVSFEGPYLPKAKRLDVAKNLFLEPHFNQLESVEKGIKGNDAFCNQKVIDNQRVFEGDEVNVLYNYAPIGLGKGKLHFLIVPKEHRSRFSDLTESEYLESMRLAQKLIIFYKDKGYDTTYLFDKSGAQAGQTVPHWHEHVVFTATKTQEFFGKLTVLKNMLIGSSPLSQKELQFRVFLLRKELTKVLTE